MKFFCLGHVCGLWKLWSRCRGSSIGLCPVWPVLPSILRRHKGAFRFELGVNSVQIKNSVKSFNWVQIIII